MKNSIKLSALFFLLSACVFASTAAEANDRTLKSEDVISLSAMPEDRGVAVNILKAESGKSFVKVFDKENHLLLKDFLPNKSAVSKGYVLTDLENGDYTIEVTSNDQVVKKAIHIYDERDKKTFIFVN